MKFGKKGAKRVSVPEEITFYLLHLSLMREYLELEFSCLKESLTTFDFDIDKIIDDWVGRLRFVNTSISYILCELK